jgi:hypothetical protein
MKNKQTELEALVKKHFTASFTERLWECKNFATWDLWHGPMLPSEKEAEGYPEDLNFVTACAELRAWWDEQIHEVWVDTDCDFIQTSEPQAWEDEEGAMIEPCWECFVHFDAEAIKRAVFNNKLWEYV